MRGRRVLVATSTYPRWSGDTHPRFVHDLCARLVADHDAEVTVIAPTSHGAARREVVDGVTVERFAYWRDRPGLLRDGPALPTLRAHPSTALQVPTYLAAMAGALRRNLRAGVPWDVVHAHWLVPQATIASLVRGRSARRREQGPRLVATSHGSDVFALDRLGPVLRWTLQRVDAVTGVSQAVVDRARELGLPASTPAVVAPMGVDTDTFRPDEDRRAQRRAQLGLGDSPLLLAVGRLVHGKGIDALLDALPQVVTTRPDVRVAILGHGGAREHLEKRRDALALQDHVTFHGFVEHAELADWYRAADLLVGTSRSEGFGLVHAEALATGCPVIATDLPAVREILAGTVGRTVPVDDRQALTVALLEHLGSGDAVRARALDDAPSMAGRFGWRAAADRYAQVLFDQGAPR